MIEIDGSYGEGGGQIVRTSVALSAVTGKGVLIKRIRQGRPKPGLAAQHAQAIKTLGQICNAAIKGAEPGSSEVLFCPQEICGGNRRVEIGTAGSVTLLMQCLLPALLHAEKRTSLHVQGGTDVQWSPTVDYFRNVFLPALSFFGGKARLELLRRGYYPRGQGEVLLEVEPSHLKSAHISYEQFSPAQDKIRGISHCSNLPQHVVERQAGSAIKCLQKAGYEAEVLQETSRVASSGSGITLWTEGKGASSLGERGLAAEKVGAKAAEEMIRELASPSAVDAHLADQLIPYLALAGGSYTVREISLHTKTNIWTAGHFMDAKFEIRAKEGIFSIESSMDDN